VTQRCVCGRSLSSSASTAKDDRPPTAEELAAMYEKVDGIIDEVRAQVPKIASSKSMDMRGLFEGARGTGKKDVEIGKITLDEMEELFRKHALDARKHTPETLAADYKLDPEKVSSLLSKCNYVVFDDFSNQ